MINRLIINTMNDPVLQMPEAVKQRLISMSKHLQFIPSLILDIGAYKGFWAKNIKEIFPSSSLFMVEGSEEHRNELEQTLLPFEITVLSDSEKNIIFHKTKAKYSTGNSIYREKSNIFTDNHPLYYTEEKRTRTLNDIARQYNLVPDMIKLDVQGAEKDIILGGVNVVRGCKIIFIELSVSEYNQGSPLLLEMVQFLDQLGFRLYDIVNLLYDVTEMAMPLCQIDAIFVRKDLK